MRITTPPASLIPLYRTRSDPTTVGERQSLLKRTEAAKAMREYEAAQPGIISALIIILCLLATGAVCFMVPRPPKQEP